MSRWLAGIGLVALCFLQAGFGEPQGAAQARAPELRIAVGQAEREMRSCAVAYRREAGLGPLRGSRVLDRAARLQARSMARAGYFSHTDPQGRGPLERVGIYDRAGNYLFVGENIAAGYPSAEVACEAWMKSPGHRANILRRRFDSIGAGFASGGKFGRYYVQVFAERAGRR